MSVRYPRYASPMISPGRALRMRELNLLYRRAAGPDADADDDELGGIDRADADVHDETAIVEIVLRHGLRHSALNEESLFRLGAHNSALAPDGGQEGGDALREAAPKALIVGLKDGPLRAQVERSLEKDEQAADVDVLPSAVRGHAPRAVDAEAAVLRAEVAQHIDVGRVEYVLIARTELELQTVNAGDDYIRRCLPDAARVVRLRIDSGHVA